MSICLKLGFCFLRSAPNKAGELAEVLLLQTPGLSEAGSKVLEIYAGLWSLKVSQGW
jgi:hypothetical protein